MDLKNYIRSIPDFPTEGILFYDISTLLAHPDALNVSLSRLANLVSQKQPDLLVGIESRGFLIAAPLASRLGIGLTMIRKKGKLPGNTVTHEYKLEYGTDTIEIQDDSVRPGQRVVIVDDLLATGGTLVASLNLLREIGADVVGAACLIELSFLKGRDRLGIPFDALMDYAE